MRTRRGAVHERTRDVFQVAGAHPSPPLKNMVWIPGGSFSMGSDTHYLEEGTVQWTTVGGFWMDAHPVSNAQFAEFVAAYCYAGFQV
jgi:formylglycine-generating enzyme required for sulfatase activity